MKRFVFVLLAFFLLSLPVAFADGLWKAYMAYAEPTEIEQANGNIIYVLASNGLYSYNQSDHSLTTYDKTNRLSDCTISHIAWNQQARRLVIAYDNGNIDLMDNSGNVTNLTDFANSSASSTVINDIYSDGAYAYLSTGIGVLRLNVAKAEISDTYSLGFEVDYVYIADGYIYAASKTKGIYRALLTDNLLDRSVWTRIGNYTASTKTLDPELLALVKTLNPGGPKYNRFWSMRFKNNRLYTTAGGWGHLIDSHNPGAIQVLDGDAWEIYQDSGFTVQTGIKYIDVNTIDVDPRDASHVMAGAKAGLYEFYNGRFQTLYNSKNSPIESFNGSSMNYQMITGTCYDRSGNLWLFESQAPNRSLMEYTADGKWKSIDKPEFMTLRDNSTGKMKSAGSMEGLFFDSRDLLWMCNNHSDLPALYCYQPSTDAVRSYTSFVNEDGQTMSVTFVKCVAEDREGNLWIATNAGPVVLSADDIANGNTVFTQVKVPRNDGTNLADYLLADVDISCIAIDRANRKWFGTIGNGVYCISSDNYQQVHHFTSSNSNLLSDNIQSIAINSNTGEVYIGTDKGLCSYMSDANTASDGMTEDNVWAYPNPVKPEYTGPVTIRGLEDGASVRIVTSSGYLVDQGTASGGEYKWYAQDRDNHRVASGIYMVLVATADGDKGVVCKVAVVN